MRDSRIGTYGALALGLTLALKATALAAMPAGLAAAALIAAHAVSRALRRPRRSPPAATSAPPAPAASPPPASAAAASPSPPPPPPSASLVPRPVPASRSPPLIGLAAGHLLARLSFERRLGGYTGDCLGATQQLTEAAIYLALLAWL